MYYLFRYHNIMPADIYWLPVGEKHVLYAFMNYEIEERNKENKAERME